MIGKGWRGDNAGFGGVKPVKLLRNTSNPISRNEGSEATCLRDTHRIARAAASATHQMIDQEAKGAYDTP